MNARTNHNGGRLPRPQSRSAVVSGGYRPPCRVRAEYAGRTPTGRSHRGCLAHRRSPMRFPIRVDPWWYPVLALFGVSSSRSYVAVEDATVEVRFGFYRHRLRRDNVVAARRVRRSWLYRLAAGIGWHTDFVNGLVVNGSLGGLLELQLAAPERSRLLGIPIRFRRLWISLEQPDAFLRALVQPVPLR